MRAYVFRTLCSTHDTLFYADRKSSRRLPFNRWKVRLRMGLRNYLQWIICALAYIPFLSPATESAAFSQQGKASHYSDAFQGKRTTSGERFDNDELVAAHKTLPLGTKVEVTNLENDKKVTVRINDRGPHKPGRVIDLSQEAARKVDMLEEGVVPVKVEKVD
jgi:rare lipoprotein A